MKKTGSRRGSGYESGLGSAVLTAPEESYALETEARGTRKGPAPAGALQRGYGKDGYGSEEYDEPGRAAYTQDEPEYVPQRGQLRLRFRGTAAQCGGRIVLGVVVVAVLAAAAVAVAGVRYYLMHDARFVLATTGRYPDYRGGTPDAGPGTERVWSGPGAEYLSRVAGGEAGGFGAAAVGGACDRDAAAAACAAGADYGADAGGVRAPGDADWAGGWRAACCWICHRMRRAIRTTRFRC